MRRTIAMMCTGIFLASGGAAAQAASTSPPPPEPTLGELGMVIYPAQGQSPEQQAADEDACYTWAEAQTGIHLTAGPVDTRGAGEAAAQQAARATQGAAVGGAARGALAGTAIGAIAGDTKKGAAIGAAAGAMGGLASRRAAVDRAGAAGAAGAQSQNQQLIDRFKTAAQVCLEGRGYTAR
jgi:hypothetical protein